MSPVQQSLASLGSGALVVHDLTAPLSADTPTLTLPDPFVNLVDFSLQEVSAYNDPGPFWKHNNIKTGEHIGTHLDAPIHWISGKDGKDVAQIEPRRLVGPAVVLDFSAEAAQDSDFLIDVEHIEAWQDAHGPIPENAWLLFRTGWNERDHDKELFLNMDDSGSHTPGFTVACARYIAGLEQVSGVGVETVGIDAGTAGSFDPPFPMHHYLLGADKYGVTSLKNLDRLPIRGSMILVAPLPIVGGTGAPARVLALCDNDANER